MHKKNMHRKRSNFLLFIFLLASPLIEAVEQKEYTHASASSTDTITDILEAQSFTDFESFFNCVVQAKTNADTKDIQYQTFLKKLKQEKLTTSDSVDLFYDYQTALLLKSWEREPIKYSLEWTRKLKETAVFPITGDDRFSEKKYQEILDEEDTFDAIQKICTSRCPCVLPYPTSAFTIQKFTDDALFVGYDPAFKSIGRSTQFVLLHRAMTEIEYAYDTKESLVKEKRRPRAQFLNLMHLNARSVIIDHQVNRSDTIWGLGAAADLVKSPAARKQYANALLVYHLLNLEKKSALLLLQEKNCNESAPIDQAKNKVKKKPGCPKLH